MRIKNHTDIPNGTIRKIVRFVCPPGVSGFDVRVSNYGRERGLRAWRKKANSI